MASPSSNNQIVIAYADASLGFDALSSFVKGDDIVHHYFDVFVVGQYTPDWLCYVRGGQCGCGYLVQERLKGVMVFAIKSVISTFCELRARAAASPANPPPTITTFVFDLFVAIIKLPDLDEVR